MSSNSRHLVLLAFTLGTVACRWETDLPSDATAIAVNPQRELLIVDDDVLSGDLARNATSGPLSFRDVVRALGLADDAPLAWLDAWSARLKDEHDEARARTFDSLVTCHWLRATPENGCDASCSTCSSRHLSMAAAPFRLTAVVNRTDLSVMPDRAADGGEGRLVFALTEGAADDPSSVTQPFAVIFEYAQAGTAREWTERWHALGTATDFPTDLTSLTERFVGSGALAQVRTADALTGPMVFHQFHIESGALVPVNVRNTPDWPKVSPDALRSYATANAASIADGTFVLPASWLASYSSPSILAPAWSTDLPQHDALIRQTCAGCHAQSESGFHIDPRAARGQQATSRFLVDPTKGQDELRRRVEWMQLTLTQP